MGGPRASQSKTNSRLKWLEETWADQTLPVAPMETEEFILPAQAARAIRRRENKRSFSTLSRSPSRSTRRAASLSPAPRSKKK